MDKVTESGNFVKFTENNCEIFSKQNQLLAIVSNLVSCIIWIVYQIVIIELLCVIILVNRCGIKGTVIYDMAI